MTKRGVLAAVVAVASVGAPAALGSVSALAQGSSAKVPLELQSIPPAAAHGIVPAPTAQQASATPVYATVTGYPVGRIPYGFLGLSTEIRGLEGYTGFDSHAINPVFEQLLRNLDPGQRPVLRLGGDTGDWTWYPVRHMGRPLGVRYALTPTWFSVAKALAKAIDARLIVAVNLEVNSSRVAAAEARAIVAGIGSRWLEALQLGNEPELYNVLAWFAVNNVPYFGRPPSWDFPDFLSDYRGIAGALPNFPLAGPEVGTSGWVDDVGQFLSQEPRVRIATVHRYALGCDPASPATIPELLSDSSTRDFDAGLGSALAAAHARGLPLRLDEMNTVSCAGQPGVSNTFAAGLWGLDVAFELARAGFAGINVHTREGIVNQLFAFRRAHGVWEGHVEPNYYGYLTFARAAPAGSRLMHVAGPTSGSVHVWATRARNGTERVVLINMALEYGRMLIVRAGSRGEVASLERLTAPSAGATGGVKLAGQSFGTDTRTGILTGKPRVVPVARTRSGAYQVYMPAASAAILTLKRR